LSRFGAGVDDILRNHDAVLVFYGLGDAAAVHRLGNIEAAVADIDPDAGGLIIIGGRFAIGWFRHGGSPKKVTAPNG
jgi:hypothetical protein